MKAETVKVADAEKKKYQDNKKRPKLFEEELGLLIDEFVKIMSSDDCWSRLCYSHYSYTRFSELDVIGRVLEKYYIVD